VHLLVNELCEYQNVRCNDKNYQTTQLMFNRFSFFENCHLVIMWDNMAGPDSPQMTI